MFPRKKNINGHKHKNHLNSPTPTLRPNGGKHRPPGSTTTIKINLQKINGQNHRSHKLNFIPPPFTPPDCTKIWQETQIEFSTQIRELAWQIKDLRPYDQKVRLFQFLNQTYIKIKTLPRANLSLKEIMISLLHESQIPVDPEKKLQDVLPLLLKITNTKQ